VVPTPHVESTSRGGLKSASARFPPARPPANMLVFNPSKTIEAGLILRELHARRELRRVLVVCSKALIVEEKRQQEMRRFDEEFTPLDGAALRHCLKQTDLDGAWPELYARAILPFSLFNEEFVLGVANGARRVKGLLELSPRPAFDLIIVDEAHNARNPESWLHRGLRVLCGEAETVLFLTATPIQLGSHELFHLLNLLFGTSIAICAASTSFAARSNIPSSVLLPRGRSRSRGRRLASAYPSLMRICRGPLPTREPRPIFRHTH
jgi:SNF2 family DNA or RNA helicase